VTIPRVPLAILLFAVTAAVPAIGENPDETELIVKYVNARETQQKSLKGVKMEVEIDGRLPKLEKKGTLRALRSITKLGQIIYKPMWFSGDNTVKQELIARYLSAEVEERDRSQMAISPANYKFKLKSISNIEGRNVAIFELNPKKKRVGLFKGELWVDAETGMPLKERGRWVKNPSVFLKKVEFEQDYELKDGVSIPKHIESKMEVRLVGLAELDIAFHDFERQDEDHPARELTAQ
jgi:hypothetical protein